VIGAWPISVACSNHAAMRAGSARVRAPIVRSGRGESLDRPSSSRHLRAPSAPSEASRPGSSTTEWRAALLPQRSAIRAMFPGRGSAETEVRAQPVHDEVHERSGREQVTLRLPDLAGDTAPRLQR